MELFRIVNGQVVLNFNKKFNSRKTNYINRLIKSDSTDTLIAYLMTLNGDRRRGSCIRDHRDGSISFESFEASRYLKLFNDSIDCNKNHKPVDLSKKYVGIELECLFPMGSLDGVGPKGECSHCDGTGRAYADEDSDDFEDCEYCNGSGQTTNHLRQLRELFKVERISRVTIKDDGSINEKNGYFSAEFNILCPQNDLSKLEKVCSFLNKHKAIVDKSCGMHIHLDMRGESRDELNMKRITNNYKRSMSVLASLVPVSRRNNRYCALKVSKINGDRYCAVNMTALSKFNTIEIRLHSSTTDFKKVAHWIKLNMAILNSRILRKVNDLNQLTEFISISEDTLEYFTQRAILFGTEGIEASIEAQDLDQNNEEAA
jgi:hypothetical protein